MKIEVLITLLIPTFFSFSQDRNQEKSNQQIMINIGDIAPAINSIDENGEVITLSQFKGKKVVLYFYPKDMTPGCTVQSCNLRDNYKTLLDKGYVVLGCSADSPARHIKFIEKYDLPFSLISDEGKKVVKDYGVWGLKKFMGKEYMGISRTTFVIDEKGMIEDVITKVDTKDHTSQILK